MPGNFGIPNEGASLDALGSVIDANSDALEAIIAAAEYPLTALLTDNQCVFDGINKRLNRYLNKSVNDVTKELSRIADALVATLGATVGSTQEELNRALALAEDVAIPDREQPDVQPLADVGPDIQDVLEGDEAAGGDFGNDAPATQGALHKAAAQALPPEIGEPAFVPGFAARILQGEPEAHRGTVPCAMGGHDVQLPDALAGGLPIPGSDAFYEQIDAYLAAFDALGAQLLAFGVEQISKENLQAIFAKYKKQAAGRGKHQSLIYQAFILGAEYLIDHSDTVFETFTKAVRCAWSLAQVLTPQCNLNVVAGVVVCKSVLSVLREIQAGWDAFVWAVAKIRVEIPHVENLLDHLLQYACPMEMPSPEEATEAWLRGYIDVVKRNIIWKWHGYNPSTYEPIAQSRGEMLPYREYVQFLRRAKLGQDDQVNALKSRGFVKPDEAEIAVELYDELPTINDHLLWLRKNVFDDEYVQRYHLLDGFDQRFWTKFGDDLTALGMKKEYAALHYAAHWIQPSPEQMREFVYRLRPDKVGDANAFTADDFERIMAEQDYSQLARQWFRATLFRVPALGYIRDMYRQRIITDDELISYHQDLGYSHDDSARFLRIDRIQRDRMRATQAHGWNPTAIAKAYATRQRDQQWVLDRMQELGFDRNDAIALAERADAELQGQITTRARSKLLTTTVSQITSAIKVGIVDVGQAAQLLTQVGWPAQLAQGVAQLQATQANTDRVKHVITQLRGAYHRGEISLLFTQQQLQALGITPQAVQQYLAAWQIERTPERKRRRASQIVTDLAEGMLDTPTALALLTNLGYEDADRQLYLADARRKLVEIEGNSNVLETLAGKSREEATMQLARHAGALSKRLVDDMKAAVPIAKLQKWAALGTIRQDEFVSRMALYGYDPATIELYWSEACAKKNAAGDCATPAPVVPVTPAASPAGNGDGTSAADTPVPE